MNIQEQLEKMTGAFQLEYEKAYAGILPKEVLEKGNPWFIKFLHTSALKLLKTAYEEERDRCKSMQVPDGSEGEGPYYYDQALTDTITHLNTKIAEVDRLLINK